MKIKLQGNLHVAQEVLNAVQALGVLDSSLLWVEAYSNGREQGFAIFRATSKTMSARYIMFSESRGSDRIVIYDNGDKSPNMQGNTPSEEAYKKATYFDCGHYTLAAQHIIGLLEEVPTTRLQRWTQNLSLSD